MIHKIFISVIIGIILFSLIGCGFEYIYSINDAAKINLENISGKPMGIIELNNSDVYIKAYSYFRKIHPTYNLEFQIEIQNNSDSDLEIDETSFAFKYSNTIYRNPTLIAAKEQFLYPYNIDDAFGISIYSILKTNEKKNYIMMYNYGLNEIFAPFKLIIKLKRLKDNKDVTFEIKYATETRGHLDPTNQTIIKEYEEPSSTPSPSSEYPVTSASLNNSNVK